MFSELFSEPTVPLIALSDAVTVQWIFQSLEEVPFISTASGIVEGDHNALTANQGVVSLLRNTLVSLNPEWVVSLNRNQVVNLSGFSSVSY
ncbi:hypothetical protein GCM10028826_17900 [Mucilaginibacter boryungensis]